MTAGHRAVAEAQRTAQGSDPPLGATIHRPRSPASVTVTMPPRVIACPRADNSYPLGDAAGLVSVGPVTDETHSNRAVIYHPGRAAEIADLFHCE